MLTALVRLAVRHRGVVAGLAVALVMLGVRTVLRAPLDVFPEFAPPQVSIQTEAPGLAPEQVELLVTRPVEDAINGVAGIALVRSQSIQGLSVVTAVLERGGNVLRARQALAERLVEGAARLPAAASAPVLTPLTSSSSTVLMVGITSAERSLMEQRDVVDRVVRPRLLATPGVAKVAVFGGDVREWQVQVRPEALRAHGVGVEEVAAAAAAAVGTRGGGVLDAAGQRLAVRADAVPPSPESLAEVPLRPGPRSQLRLGDVARVTAAPAVAFGEGAVDGERGIVLVVSAQLGANTRVVARAAEATLDRLAPVLAAERLTLHPDVFRPAEFIDLAIRNITVSLLLGAALVALVLAVFLADLRAAFISLTAIPLSLLGAIVVLDAFGQSLNTLTLGGLAIALGEVVDDAIIDVENIARRLRENARRPDPLPAARVVIDASLEVRSSVVYATFVVIIVFLPVVALTGVHGALFRPLALAYVLATLASLLVALTVTPALTLLLLGRREGGEHETRLLRALKGRYEAVLARLLAAPRAALAVALLACAAAAAALPFLGATFLPAFREGHYVLHMSALPGTSLEETLRLGQRVTAELRADVRVRKVAQRIGRAELSEDTWGTNYTEFEVEVHPLDGEEAEAFEGALRERLARFPGVSFALRGFLTERIEETLTGSTAPVVIHLLGTDLDSLDAAAARAARVVAGVPGAADVQYDPPAIAPEVRIRVDPVRAARAGLRPDEALAAVELALRGRAVAQVPDPARPIDLVVIADPAARRAPEGLGALPLRTADGRLVALRDVATIARASGRYAIAHHAGRRAQTVTAAVAGRDVGSFTAEVERRLREPGLLPAGTYAEVGGTGTAQRAARQELLLNSLLAAAGIVMLLALAFDSLRAQVLVLANLPFALVGGVLAVALTGAELSLGSLVGFVTLFGIATRNAVMLVSHYEHLVRVEGAPWTRATVIRGALERLGPILMTALVTAFALFPLALGSGDPGREIEGPMAIVILGGLLTSTLLSLVVLPLLAERLLREGDGPAR